MDIRRIRRVIVEYSANYFVIDDFLHIASIENSKDENLKSCTENKYIILHSENDS